VRKTKSLFFLILLAQTASAETLRLSVNDAIRMALSTGT